MRSRALRVHAEASVAHGAGKGPIVRDTHARVAADDAFPFLARVASSHVECLLGGRPVGEDDRASGAGNLFLAFAGETDHVGIVESIVLASDGRAGTDPHEDRQLAHGGQVVRIGRTEEVTPEHAGNPSLVEEDEGVSGRLEPGGNR